MDVDVSRELICHLTVVFRLCLGCLFFTSLIIFNIFAYHFGYKAGFSNQNMDFSIKKI